MNFDRLHISETLNSDSNGYLHIPRGILASLSEKAFLRLAHSFTEEHLDHLIEISKDTTTSENDRLVAHLLLENAVIASRGVLPLCQDTGTSQIFAWKDSRCITSSDDIEELSSGAKTTYNKAYLRNSTTLPTNLCDEFDPLSNEPTQVLIQQNSIVQNTPSYYFLFCAKGGGSSNKTSFFQMTKAILTEEAFTKFLEEKIPALGTGACPPYTISIVVGGISPEQNLLALKLATANFFDQEIPGLDNRIMGCKPLRLKEWEDTTLKIASETGLGAQFGGKALASAAVVLRFPRHGASCPVSIGVSCSAHRNLFARIDSTGVYLQKTISEPEEIISRAGLFSESTKQEDTSNILNFDEGIQASLKNLSEIPVGKQFSVSGSILVARDAAHARWRTLIENNKPLPDYLTTYPILYAGPARTPKNGICGSLGPTTAGRMDDYAEELMSRGVALITIAKGNRSETWRTACKKYGAAYLGTIGGAAALITERHITGIEIIDYPDLGMEAVHIVRVVSLPVFMLITTTGEDFYAKRGCQ